MGSCTYQAELKKKTATQKNQNRQRKILKARFYQTAEHTGRQKLLQNSNCCKIIDFDLFRK